jgi:hypothetical protein
MPALLEGIEENSPLIPATGSLLNTGNRGNSLRKRVLAGVATIFALACVRNSDRFFGTKAVVVDAVAVIWSFLESTEGWWKDVINFDAGYSASGHSTGGRAVLMLAALVDNPTKYLVGTKYGLLVTEKYRRSIQKFQAIVGDHPDPIYLPGFNPDVDNFVVDKTPVMIVSGSADHIEPKLSAWKDFETIASPNKVYVDMLGAGHLGPLVGHKEGPYIAYFSRCFIDGIDPDFASTGCENIYGDSNAEAMRKVLSIATIGDRNTGNGTVGFLACQQGGDGIPADFAEFCTA